MRMGFSALRLLSIGLAATAVVPFVSAVGQRPTTVRDQPHGHQKWYYDERAYPFDIIAPDAMASARRQLRNLGGFSAAPPPPTLPGATGGWTSLGPSAIDISLSTFFNGTSLAGGRVEAIAVDPTTSSIIYAGTFGGGIWKTVNAGVTWTPISDNQCSLYIGALAIDPVNPNIVYAGTADPLNGANSLKACGLLRSIDAGATWTEVGTNQMESNLTQAVGQTNPINKIVIDKATAGSTTTTIVLATSVRGLYRSTNSGTTWTQVTGMTGWFTDMVADPSTPGTVYAASRQFFTTQGLFKSVNSGATWTQLAGGLPTSNWGYTRLAITRTAAPTTIYAIAGDVNTSSLLGLFKSIDGGTTWTQPAAATYDCSTQCNYGLTVGVDPANGNTIYAGGLFVFKSTDGGATFANVGQAAHVDQHAMVYDPTDPNTLYIGSDGGIYRSADKGATWVGLNAGIVAAEFVKGLAVSPGNGFALMGGLQDNGSVEFGGQDQWTMIMTGDGGASAYSKNGATAWTQYIWSPATLSASAGPKRRDPGASAGGFVFKKAGIDVTDRGTFYPPLVMDPINDQTLYFGTFRVYKTTNNGELWSAVSTDLSKGSGTINVIKVAPSNPQIIYVGTTDGNVQISTNGGSTWTLSTGQPNRAVTNFAIDPVNSAVAYATFSGFGTGHVYKTTNTGTTWTNISGAQLPDAPANAVAIIPGTTEIEVGTDLGVLRTTNDGGTWSTFIGLPNVEVTDLVYDINRKMLYAATYGRGVFAFQLATTLVLRGDVTGDSQVTALDAQAALNAAVGLPLPAGYTGNPNGDVNCDGKVTALDAQIILSFVVGLNVAQFCVGFYR